MLKEKMNITPGVCASIIEKTEQDVYNSLNKAIISKSDYIELRLDTIYNINSSLTSNIIDNIKNKTEIPIILTNRTKKEGGYFQGSELDRINILKKNASKVEITDIEYNTSEEYKQQILSNANITIFSYHNFNKTPDKYFLQNIIDKSKKLKAIPKIAVMPNDTKDTLLLLDLIASNTNIIGISMDKLGKYTRITGPILGSLITYASINNSSAPGQLDVKLTKELINQLK